ncbi:MAG: MarR family transcriptional regulator [Actinomycetota bacterium]
MRLLEWYEPRRRRYPWRLDRDPYRVLVSEVMLQQTQAPRVVPAFEAFLASFPDVRALASASRGAVLTGWGSLGYNRRAASLHAAAREIVERHDGRVPADTVELSALPGVGPYTAAAVASIAFGQRVAAIDTNVARVVSRARLGTDAATKAEVAAAAGSWIDRRDPGGWNQAMMDLGRDVCRSRPRCEDCPLRRSCRFRRTGAVPVTKRPRQAPFRGSFREVRGAVMRELRSRGEVTVAAIASASGHDAGRVAAAVQALAAEGLVEPGDSATPGRADGSVRFLT